MSNFTGVRNQRGNGIGSIIWNLLKSVFPSVLNYGTNKVIDTAKDFTSQVIGGKNIIDAGKSALGKTAEDVVNDIKKQAGRGKAKPKAKPKPKAKSKAKPKAKPKAKSKAKPKPKVKSIYKEDDLMAQLLRNLQ